jgi:hypothetical protein
MANQWRLAILGNRDEPLRQARIGPQMKRKASVSRDRDRT